MTATDQLVLVWLGFTNLLALLLFGYDKFCAARGSFRVSEYTLALIGALGGWPGGLLGMLLFRHKTAKLSFKLKYAFAFLVWVGLLYASWQWRGQITQLLPVPGGA